MRVNTGTLQMLFRILGGLLIVSGIWFSYVAGLWRDAASGVVMWLPWVLAIMLLCCGVALLLRNARQRATLLAASMLIAALTGLWAAILAPAELLVVGGPEGSNTHQVFAVRMICGGSAVVAGAAFLLGLRLRNTSPSGGRDFT